MLNELAQWSVLLILAVFVLGLTRQLGIFLMPREQERSEGWGPEIGESLPPGLFSDEESARIRSIIDEYESRRAAIVIVSEQCGPCHEWVDALAEPEFNREAPIVLLAGHVSPDYREKISPLADVVLFGESMANRLTEIDMTATPLLMIVDQDLKVRQKQLGGTVQDGLGELVSTNGTGDSTAVASPEITVMNGGRA